MTNICCICLEEIHTDCTPYTCSHIIHTHCANLWNKPCPLCKSNFKKSHIQFILGEIHGFEITLDKYQQLWNNWFSKFISRTNKTPHFKFKPNHYLSFNHY